MAVLHSVNNNWTLTTTQQLTTKQITIIIQLVPLEQIFTFTEALPLNPVIVDYDWWKLYKN